MPSSERDSLSLSDFRPSEKSDTSGNSDVVVSYDKEYWLGKHYFRYCMASKSVNQCPEDGMMGIDSIHEKSFRDYPYGMVVDHLRRQGLARVPPGRLASTMNFDILMSSIGAILISGDLEDRKALMKALRRDDSIYGSHSNSNSNINDAESLYTPPANASTAQHPDASQSSMNTGLYLSALLEQEAKGNIDLTWDIRTITALPPLFDATLMCQGVRFRSEASTKKRAKHLAAQQACEYLEIRLE